VRLVTMDAFARRDIAQFNRVVMLVALFECECSPVRDRRTDSLVAHRVRDVASTEEMPGRS